MKKWEKKFEEYTKTGSIPLELLPNQEERRKRKVDIDTRVMKINADLKYAKPDEQKKLNEEKRRLLKEKFKIEEFAKENADSEMAQRKEKQEKLTENFQKIGRIKTYRDNLQNEINEIKAELNRRKNISEKYKELEKNKTEIDAKSKLIMEKNKALKELERRLDNKDLTAEQRSKLESEKTKLSNERTKAQDDLVKAQEKMPKLEAEYEKNNSQESKLSNVPSTELESRSAQIQTKISKCNFYCNNLSKGKDLSEIELSLNNWDSKNYADMQKKLETIRKGMSIAEKTNEKTPNVFETVAYEANNESIEESNKKIEELKAKLNKSLVPQSEFDKKHPRISAFLKSINPRNRNAQKEIEKIRAELEEEEKKLEKKMENKNIYEQEYGVPKTEEEKEKEEKLKEEYEKGSKEVKEHNEFIEYIRKIAEKDPKEIEKEEKEAREKAARERYAEARAKAYKNETKKFGENYSQQSKQMKNRANEKSQSDKER